MVTCPIRVVPCAISIREFSKILGVEIASINEQPSTGQVGDRSLLLMNVLVLGLNVAKYLCGLLNIQLRFVVLIPVQEN